LLLPTKSLAPSAYRLNLSFIALSFRSVARRTDLRLQKGLMGL
jgi:hypothetical protein